MLPDPVRIFPSFGSLKIPLPQVVSIDGQGVGHTIHGSGQFSNQRWVIGLSY